MKIHYNCHCADAGKCRYVENLQAVICKMEKEGDDFSFINFNINGGSDICREMFLSQSRVDITCGFLKYHSSEKDMREDLFEMLDFFLGKGKFCGNGIEEDDEEEPEFEEGFGEDYAYCDTERKLEKVKGRIRDASGKEFVAVIVESIDGDRKQAQVQVDGKTIKICKGIIDDLDEDELAGVIAHGVAHLEKRTERNSSKEEVNIDSIGTHLRKMDESLKNSGAGGVVRTIAQIAVIGIGVVGGTVIAKGEMRGREDEADSRAVDILHKAGYNPEAGADALERIDRQIYRRRGMLEDVLSTHPETKERIRRIREKVKNKG